MKTQDTNFNPKMSSEGQELSDLDNEQEAKSKLLKRALEWMCLPSNEALIKDRAEIIKEGQSFFKLIDKSGF